MRDFFYHPSETCEAARLRLFGDPFRQSGDYRESQTQEIGLDEEHLTDLLFGDTIIHQQNQKVYLIRLNTQHLIVTGSLLSADFAKKHPYCEMVPDTRVDNFQLIDNWYHRQPPALPRKTGYNLTGIHLPVAENPFHHTLLVSDYRDDLYYWDKQGRVNMYRDARSIVKKVLTTPHYCPSLVMMSQIIKPLWQKRGESLVLKDFRETALRADNISMQQLENVHRQLLIEADYQEQGYQVIPISLELPDMMALLFGATVHQIGAIGEDLLLQTLKKDRSFGSSCLQSYLEYLDTPGRKNGFKSYLRTQLQCLVAPCFEEGGK